MAGKPAVTLYEYIPQGRFTGLHVLLVNKHTIGQFSSCFDQSTAFFHFCIIYRIIDVHYCDVFEALCSKMTRKTLTQSEVYDMLDFDDDEGENCSNYGHESDFESEYDPEEEFEERNDDDSIVNDDDDVDADSEQLSPEPIATTHARKRRCRPKGNCSNSSGKSRKKGPLYSWKSDNKGFSDRDFNPNCETGPKNIPDYCTTEKSTSLDWLTLLWPNELWTLLVNETNNQADRVKAAKPNHYYAKSFYPVTIEEMKAFFGCRIAIEMLIHKPRYEQYWRQKDNNLTITPGFNKLFTRDRFLAIWSFLHCVNEDDQALDKSDKIYKTRPIFNIILEKFQHYYYPKQNLSLDEGMIPTKNALSFRQYIKDKPIRWGMKTFLVCDSDNGYICNAEVYTGTHKDANKIENLGITGNLVVRLLHPFNGQNYRVFCDRYYSGIELVQHLYQQCQIGYVGTIQTNRTGFPKDMKRKKSEMSRGESIMKNNGKVAIITWCDKKPIYLVTSLFISSPDEHVQRYDAKEHKKVPVQCPKAVVEYNKYMGGTDKNDQMTRLHKCRRHYKWPRRLMIKFFMWAAYNSYVLLAFYRPHEREGTRTVTFLQHVEILCNTLVENFERPNLLRSPRGLEIGEKRLTNVGLHIVERAPQAKTNNRCVVCQEKNRRASLQNPNAQYKDLPPRKKTVYWCTYCEKFLCIGQQDMNCWKNWHTKVEYWR